MECKKIGDEFTYDDELFKVVDGLCENCHFFDLANCGGLIHAGLIPQCAHIIGAVFQKVKEVKK